MHKYFSLRGTTMKMFCDCFLPLVRDENKELRSQMPVQSKEKYNKSYALKALPLFRPLSEVCLEMSLG